MLIICLICWTIGYCCGSYYRGKPPLTVEPELDKPRETPPPLPPINFNDLR